MQKSVLIDTDPGVDNALALNSDRLQVKAITTVCGNVDVQTATKNLFRVLQHVLALILSWPRRLKSPCTVFVN